MSDPKTSIQVPADVRGFNTLSRSSGVVEVSLTGTLTRLPATTPPIKVSNKIFLVNSGANWNLSFDGAVSVEIPAGQAIQIDTVGANRNVWVSGGGDLTVIMEGEPA